MDSRCGMDTSGQTERQSGCSFFRALWGEDDMNLWEARKEEL